MILKEFQKKRKKKRYTKEVSKFLKEELGEKMRKLTRTEGNILVKLIYRETKVSTYKTTKTIQRKFKCYVLANYG